MARKSEQPQPRAGERIAKVIARAGLASRREAEAWIAAGRVAINGKTIASPAVNVASSDRITVDGAALPARERTRLFLYHKPRGLVTTHADPERRPTIFAALPKHLPRLIGVGRLDLNTEGLLLLTNDGGLARVLELEQGSNVWLTFAIREGKNREVRNVLAHLGLKVARLIRVSFGPFQLGELPAGAIEEVKTRHLREQLGERLAKLAGCDFSAPISAAPISPIPPPKGEKRTAVPLSSRPSAARRESRDPGI